MNKQYGQRGAALVVSLIMLVLVTLLVITALNIGAANFRAVSNTQFRDEAIAAANAAIQTRVAARFTEPPSETTIPITIGNNDYRVIVNAACISASIAETAEQSSLQLPASMSLASTWNTVWDVRAEVTDAVTGANVTIRSGVRVLLNQIERNSSCPDPAP
jgi:Tfp pilus assembly protein PilX